MKSLIFVAVLVFQINPASAGITDFNALKEGFKSYGGCAGRSCSTGDVGLPRENLSGDVQLVCYSENDPYNEIPIMARFTTQEKEPEGTQTILALDGEKLGIESTSAILERIRGTDKIFYGHLKTTLRARNGRTVIARIRQEMQLYQFLYVELQERVVTGVSNWTYCKAINRI
jgi:hypothetical protein